jgi:hypothetical protein
MLAQHPYQASKRRPAELKVLRKDPHHEKGNVRTRGSFRFCPGGVPWLIRF